MTISRSRIRAPLLLCAATLACSARPLPPEAATQERVVKPELSSPARRGAVSEEQSAMPAPPVESEKKKKAEPSPTTAAGAPAPAIADTDAAADRSRSQLEVGEPVVGGGLDRDIIRRIAVDRSEELRDCHGQRLRQVPGLAGRIVVALELNREGGVERAEVVQDKSDLDDLELERCVVETLTGWTFPAPKVAGSTLELSFELSAA